MCAARGKPKPKKLPEAKIFGFALALFVGKRVTWRVVLECPLGSLLIQTCSSDGLEKQQLRDRLLLGFPSKSRWSPASSDFFTKVFLEFLTVEDLSHDLSLTFCEI